MGLLWLLVVAKACDILLFTAYLGLEVASLFGSRRLFLDALKSSTLFALGK